MDLPPPTGTPLPSTDDLQKILINGFILSSEVDLNGSWNFIPRGLIKDETELKWPIIKQYGIFRMASTQGDIISFPTLAALDEQIQLENGDSSSSEEENEDEEGQQVYAAPPGNDRPGLSLASNQSTAGMRLSFENKGAGNGVSITNLFVVSELQDIIKLWQCDIHPPPYPPPAE